MAEESGYRKGLHAEMLAAWYLRFKGYRILATRYKTRIGEIDLIAKRGRGIVFAEVKWRPDRRTAMEAIHEGNQARVRQAAELYLQKYPRYNGCETRFDALVFAPRCWPLHIKNAF